MLVPPVLATGFSARTSQATRRNLNELLSTFQAVLSTLTLQSSSPAASKVWSSRASDKRLARLNPNCCQVQTQRSSVFCYTAEKSFATCFCRSPAPLCTRLTASTYLSRSHRARFSLARHPSRLYSRHSVSLQSSPNSRTAVSLSFPTFPTSFLSYSSDAVRAATCLSAFIVAAETFFLEYTTTTLLYCLAVSAGSSRAVSSFPSTNVFLFR